MHTRQTIISATIGNIRYFLYVGVHICNIPKKLRSKSGKYKMNKTLNRQRRFNLQEIDLRIKSITTLNKIEFLHFQFKLKLRYLDTQTLRYLVNKYLRYGGKNPGWIEITPALEHLSLVTQTFKEIILIYVIKIPIALRNA